ncbi:alpha/beta hydrolase [Candidatus Roizmanbacteria bacterium]|nr:alpha/beta hydrolase [Candidatus Roizmanbacteria bacterium]
MKKITKKTFHFEGKKYYYWVAGRPSSPPLLMIPGLTGTHGNLLEVSYPLRKHNYLILPDLPGWGLSPRPQEALTIAYYARFYQALRKHLKIEKVNIFSHCMGTAVAMAFACLNSESVNRLIMVSVPYEEGSWGYHIFKSLSTWGEKVPRSFRPFFYIWRNKYINFISGFFILKFRSFKKKMRMLVEIFREQAVLDNQSFVESWLSLMDFDYGIIKNVAGKFPIHLIFGSQDLLIPKSQATKFCNLVHSQCTMDFIPEAGHLPPTETPHILAGLVRKYLEG